MARWIPFRLLPGSWGLAGRAYAEAEAYYELSGEALDRRLAAVRNEDDPAALALANLEIDVRYNRLDPYEADLRRLQLAGEPPDPRAVAKLDRKHGRISEAALDARLAELDTRAGIERDLALLDVKLKHGEITKLDADKQRATLQETPWIGIVDQGFDLEQGVNGVFFEFDWNSHWIDYLRLNGYTGRTDEDIVEEWFQNVCRATASAPLADDFDVPAASPARKPNSVRRPDGTFYR